MTDVMQHVHWSGEARVVAKARVGTEASFTPFRVKPNDIKRPTNGVQSSFKGPQSSSETVWVFANDGAAGRQGSLKVMSSENTLTTGGAGSALNQHLGNYSTI